MSSLVHFYFFRATITTADFPTWMKCTVSNGCDFAVINPIAWNIWRPKWHIICENVSEKVKVNSDSLPDIKITFKLCYSTTKLLLLIIISIDKFLLQVNMTRWRVNAPKFPSDVHWWAFWMKIKWLFYSILFYLYCFQALTDGLLIFFTVIRLLWRMVKIKNAIKDQKVPVHGFVIYFKYKK